MKTWLKIYIIVIACVAFTACSHSDDREGDAETMPIAFNSMDMAMSRASELNDIYDNFVVRAIKTMGDDSKQVVMPYYVVKYGDTEKYGSHWYYDGINSQALKFWDMSAAVYTFAAVAPAAGSAVVNIDDDGKIEVNNARGNMIEGTEGAADWMIARTIRTKATLTDVDDIVGEELPSSPVTVFFDEVPMMFHHIMSKIVVRVYCYEGEVSLQSFKIIPDTGSEIYTSANYTDSKPWTAPSCWTDYADLSGSAVFDKTYGYASPKAVGTTSETATTMFAAFEIPQSWERKTFLVEAMTSHGKVITGRFTLDGDYTSWDTNTVYIYTLAIPAGSDEIILVDITVDDWSWGGEDVTIDEPQTNW